LEDISCISRRARGRRINAIQQATVERVLIDIANAQGGMERIKNAAAQWLSVLPEPLYARVLHAAPIALVRSLGLATPIGSTLIGLVFLAVLSIGEDLTDPFANSVHDVRSRPCAARSRSTFSRRRAASP
jgi:putative membrane protein